MADHTLRAVRGMNDILPAEIGLWQRFEDQVRAWLASYGYQEIRTPILEHTGLFKRAIGEVTDIVEKEMYTFVDELNGESLTLRPEGTASAVRAAIEHNMLFDGGKRLWYQGPMFRHERPQKGRYRQFHQIGAEIIGVEDPRIDAQLLAMLDHYFAAVGIGAVALQINSRGCPQCRPGYRQALIAFLQDRLDSLCDDCRRRYQTNPLRVLDCKVPGCREATAGAPSVLDHLCGECAEHFSRVKGYLADMKTPFTVNERMVRGLDYYTKTTFEMVTGSLGSQNAVAAGGRYDGLISDLGGPALPGIGFAMGLERLVLMKGEARLAAPRPALFLAAIGEEASRQAFLLMSRLQRREVFAEMDYEGKSLKAQMRRAGKLQARQVLILGEEELARQVGQLKDMDTGAQREVPLADLERLMTEGGIDV